MLSLNQSIEVRESILAYLRATFNFQDKEVDKAFYDFVNDPKEGLFKGPYISLKLPFVKADKAVLASIPLTIKPEWLPYNHQVKSWYRLSSQEQPPQATIVTTGTGSGKTESFLYPLLDYCHKNKGKAGIKVIILYPMNALATDQAKRLAEAIYEDDRIKGKVTAGLFIGEGKDAAKYPKTMGPENIIENREAILKSPPDILLTNFKMLDYGLMKSNYDTLWQGNYKDTTLLQFLVLDELHTYDGAQGTDVANLIRRLKLKLSLDKGQLCAVGTSATIGSGAEAPQLLSEYASKIFGEDISPQCIIHEDRLGINDYFEDENQLETYVPRAKALLKVKPLTDEGYETYIERQIDVWQLDESSLSDDLLKLKIVKDLVGIVNRDKGIVTFSDIIVQLKQVNEVFAAISDWHDEYQFNPQESLVSSLLALISEAKVIDPENGRKSPFLYLQVQLWVRELSGILRTMSEQPQFVWRENVDQSDGRLALPPWFCRECGASGWLGVKHDNKERFERDILDVYSKFFENHKHIYFANRTSWFSQQKAADVGYEARDQFSTFVFDRNLEFFNEAEEGRVDISAFRRIDRYGRNEHVCPECNTKNTVAVIGTRIATLSSVAVSQVLSTDLDEQNEKQRKVLAFTNGVQDAAHQAGFIESRNYRFAFRASLQKVINENEAPRSLTQLSKDFMNYWKGHADEAGQHSLDAYYYRFYPTDYLGKSSPYDYEKKGKYTPAFVREFDTRMSWEVFSEFSYNALIGRTLEKTHSSATFFQDEDVMAVWDKMKVWLEKNDTTQTIKQDAFCLFLKLILHRLRTRGAVSHPFFDKFRKGDLKLWDLNWNKDKRHFLNKGFSPKSRLPKLISYEPDGRGLLDTTFTRKSNWFHQYYAKTFQQAVTYVDNVNEFYEQLIQALFACELLDKEVANGHMNYALNPNKLYVSNKVAYYVCEKCGHQLHVADTHETMVGGKCLNYRCVGTYESSDELDEANYYSQVYNRNRSPRIYAADHTGLLERKDREILEYDFKNRPHFRSKNAMVATSTLEMGIDIGSLNTAFNNTVPPLPSNYLQRIGRAGRSSGSALIVNFVKNQAHDLFYYQEPLDMMAGDINTPGCYLEAKEILRRHFFAYCIDSWTKLNPEENKISYNIRVLNIESSDLSQENFFINRIINYIKVNRDTLFNNFKGAYEGEVDVSVFDALYAIILSESFFQFYLSIFLKIKASIKDIRGKLHDIETRQEELSKEDPERKELESEIKNLKGIIFSIKKRQVLEHLTNVGALPNYAFPETGVTLSAKVLGNRALESNKPPLNKDFEIVRSANQAIKEFAPDNDFYSQGYKFHISGVNTFEWSDEGSYHMKRFCSNCDHLELADIATEGVCPKCGDESWQAASNVHRFAKLGSVKSFNNKSDAALKDSTDERTSVVYNVKRHFNFNNSSSLGAWAMKEIPFGIEFVKNVSIIESNLGRMDALNDARRVQIDELEVPAHGFVTCKYCGKSSSHIRQRNYKQHYAYCKHKDKEYQGKTDDVFEEIFFFREVQTEVLKVLLPVQELNSESEVKMFQAGIELGLKRYFKGNPQHVRITNYREYNQITSKFDKYLLMYDAIPGGTGYLEKLFDVNEFTQLLTNAYDSIKNCSCKERGLDGCYRCIYSYSNQYYQLELSRAVSEKRFEKIIEESTHWEKQTKSLGDLTNQGKIEESELEEKFIRSLKTFASAMVDWSFDEINEDGTVSYTLCYSKDDKAVSLHIRPQVELGEKNGVGMNTRTDFMITCTEYKNDGKEVEVLSIPQIAIYLDGYQYHASSEHNRFVDDVNKRMAILDSKQYLTWSLTWDDIVRFDTLFVKPDDHVAIDDVLANRLSFERFKLTRTSLLAANNTDVLGLSKATNNLERLMQCLTYIGEPEILKKGIVLNLGLFQKHLFNPSYAPNDVEKALEAEVSMNFLQANRTLDGLCPVSLLDNSSLFSLKTAVNFKKVELLSRIELLDVDDITKDEWNTYWILFNLLQFFDMEIRDSVDMIK